MTNGLTHELARWHVPGKLLAAIIRACGGCCCAPVHGMCVETSDESGNIRGGSGVRWFGGSACVSLRESSPGKYLIAGGGDLGSARGP